LTNACLKKRLVESLHFYNHILRRSLSTYILWLRIFGNMPSGIQHYWSIWIYINKQCSRVNILQISNIMWHKHIYFLSELRFEPRMNYGRLSQLCHAAALTNRILLVPNSYIIFFMDYYYWHIIFLLLFKFSCNPPGLWLAPASEPQLWCLVV
jgi:hypothetical protein